MRFTEVKVYLGNYENKKIPLYGPNKQTLKFQIPRMYIPFGLNGFTPEVGPTKWNIDFNLNGLEEDNETYIKRFYRFVKDVEKDVIDYVQKNSLDIFGKEVDAKSMFNSNIKTDKFRLKFDPSRVSVFDTAGNPVLDDTKPGLYSKHSGVCMVELGNVYFLNNMFGITWKISQMKIFEPQRLKGFSFIGIE